MIHKHVSVSFSSNQDSDLVPELELDIPGILQTNKAKVVWLFLPFEVAFCLYAPWYKVLLMLRKVAWADSWVLIVDTE